MDIFTTKLCFCNLWQFRGGTRPVFMADHPATIDLDKQDEQDHVPINTTGFEMPPSDGTHIKHRRSEPWRARSWSCSRCCILSFLILFLIVLGIILGFLLWARIPVVSYKGTEPQSTTIPVFTVNVDNFLVRLNVKLLVQNPNYVALTLHHLSVAVTYPTLPNTTLAYASIPPTSIPAKSTQLLHVPVEIRYGQGLDPNNLVSSDLAKRCAIFTGGPKQPIVFDYTVNVTAQVVAIPVVMPTFPGSISLTCPTEFNSSAPLLNNVP